MRNTTLVQANSSDHSRGIWLLRLGEVKARTGLGRSRIYALCASNDFPRPVKLGERASAWVSTEIDAWIAARIAARDAKDAR
jgi:prophage regulatory protein